MKSFISINLIRIVFVIVVILFSYSIIAVDKNHNSDVIKYRLEYIHDLLEINDFDTIWNIRCVIEFPPNKNINKFGIYLSRNKTPELNIIETQTPILSEIAIVNMMPQANYNIVMPKREITDFKPSYYKQNNKIIIDFGYHNSNDYNIEIEAIDEKDNIIKDVILVKGNDVVL